MSPNELYAVPKPAPCMNTMPGRRPVAPTGSRMSTVMSCVSSAPSPCTRHVESAAASTFSSRAPPTCVPSRRTVMETADSFTLYVLSPSGVAPSAAAARDAPDVVSNVTAVSSVSVAMVRPVGSLSHGTVVRFDTETSRPIRMMKIGRLTDSLRQCDHGMSRVASVPADARSPCATALPRIRLSGRDAGWARRPARWSRPALGRRPPSGRRCRWRSRAACRRSDPRARS